ncbi:uncharacterized protein LOC111083029 [Limulus polyphemus]|uniref:Uncharacterized protein LOC111083029 n=1 Tax=Limulus polyphemus TaxID=6850 RepID=A0ABM1TDQ1_LIMPO|nr:uncharacterized protein LOC111083029 [Limulus polyphemus]
MYWFKNARAAYKKVKQSYFVAPNRSHSSSEHYCEASSHNNTSDSYFKNSTGERRKRNCTFIDSATEEPRMEQWFTLNTHPSHRIVVCLTHELNVMPYCQKFPKLKPKNIHFWFKNRRAKCKWLNLAAVKDWGPVMDRLSSHML